MDLVDRFIHKYGRLPTEFDPDYLEMLRMSKYRIVAVPDFKPGKCANCGSSKNDGREYIDFGLEVDWYGIVFICGTCLIDVANHMGLFNQLRDQLSRVTDSLLNVEKKNFQGVDLRDSFLKIFKEVQDYFAQLPAIRDVPVVDSNDNVDKPAAIETEPTIATIKSAADAAKSGTTKSATGSRPKNLPSLAELLNSTPE